MPGVIRERPRIESDAKPFDPYQQSVDAVNASYTGLTAAAQQLNYANTANLIIPPREWQTEAWGFYDTLGEVGFAIGTWLANMMSRVRLVVATKPVDSDEPVIVKDGPAAKLLSDLVGGPGGQAALLKRMTVHVSVPGESYMVIEKTLEGGTTVRAYSSSELRIKSRHGSTTRYDTRGEDEPRVMYEVMTDRAMWRDLSVESLVCRIWNPDDQYSWAAASVMRTALPICREVDFYNRYIIAILLSRMAMNGMLLWPAEAGFSVKEAYKDSPDPMMSEMIDIASRSIANPGTASAAIPWPVKMPADLIEKVRHLTFSTEMSQHLLENRQEALKRLAVSLNLPTEVLTGMGDLNHWGQWQLEESGIKTYISPIAEILCAGITVGAFIPLLEADGSALTDAKGDAYFVWYDPTALTQQPDKTDPAQQGYDDGALKETTYVDAIGFSSDDIPTTEEFKTIALKKIALGGGADAMKALSILTGDKSLMPDPAPAPAPDGTTGQPPEGSPGESEAPAQTQSPASVPRTTPSTRPASLGTTNGVHKVLVDSGGTRA